MKIIKSENITWIDLSSPNEENLSYLKEIPDIHPLAIEEFSMATYRPRAIKYPKCLFLSIHIPLFNREDKTTYSSEIDIIITQTHLITGHNSPIFQVKRFIDILAKDSDHRHLFMSKTPAHLLHEILRILIESCFPRVDHIDKNIDIIEDKVFKGEEYEMVREISMVKRDILDFRRAVMPQKTVLESLLRQPENIISSDLKAYYHDLLGTNVRLWNTLESSLETIKSLEETNNSLLSQKINRKMRVMTIFSAILLPVSLYIGILSVAIPLSHNPQEFWMHLAVMFMLSFVTFLFFKFSKWL